MSGSLPFLREARLDISEHGCASSSDMAVGALDSDTPRPVLK